MNKNKIIIDSNTYIIEKSGNYFLNPNDGDYNIIVNSNIKCQLVIISENRNYKVSYLLNDNSNLEVYSLNKDSNMIISFDLMENANLIYNNSVLAKKDSISNIVINHLENNSSSVINNNGINFTSNKLYFVLDGIIKNELTNITCSQNSKIINFLCGNSKVIPNLIIDSNDIVANHSAYIGRVSDDDMFYLQSRGINKEDVKKLICKGLLLSQMDFSIIDEFTRLINEWW